MIPTAVYSLIGTCLLLYVLLYLLSKKIKDTSKYLKNLRGPKPIFPFGNTLDFFWAPTVLMLDNFREYFRKYGDTIIVHDGAFSWAVLTIDYEFNELIYNSPHFHEKAKQYSFLEGWLGQGLLTSKGYQWRSHRKVITPSFHFSILQEFISVFDNVGDNLVKRLKQEVGKDETEISKIVSLYALDVICEAAMGLKINALDRENSEYIRSIKTLCQILIERVVSIVNPIVYPFTWKYHKEKKALKVVHKHVEGVISKRMEEHKQSKRAKSVDLNDECGMKKRLAFLDLLLEARIDGQPLSKEDLRDEVNTFMFEGHDTTSSAITFCLLMLATHADVQEKVYKEETDIFGFDLKAARPSYKELNEMKYLDLVIKETLRLFPSVPFYARKLATNLEFKGSLYPKGLSLMVIPYISHRNPDYFPNPENFIPERFEDTATSRPPFVYTPFSAGPRNCIGQKFAMLEMLSTVSKIVRNFELAPAKPEHRIQIAAETILISKTGVKISLIERP